MTTMGIGSICGRRYHAANGAAALTLTMVVSLLGCGDSVPPGIDGTGDDSTNESSDTSKDTPGEGEGEGEGHSAAQYPELWYASGESLIHVKLSEDNGSVVQIQASALPGLRVGYNCITMLDDGSLLGARLANADNRTYFYHIKHPPRDGSPAVYDELGVMPDNIQLEGLYTDCEGRLYGMDTGVDAGSPTGNRLLRFLGNYVEGDFEYEVVSDLSSAVVADIDDMGPGIDENGNITDNPGLAIDTGTIYDFDYVLGTGTSVAKGGTWGIHALGGALFKDEISRIYLLSSQADIFELDPDTYAVSDLLDTGPNADGWSGMTGPLTDCESGFPPIY